MNTALILMGLIGGLALFLHGINEMTEALKVAGGGAMRRFLAALTRNRFTATFAGAVVTAIVQSSSVTTVLVVGFISAGVMNFTQSIGVIIGANIGTTITAQIIAFKVTQYALALVATGFVLRLAANRRGPTHWGAYGAALMGLGFIFLGMDTMREATRPLHDFPPFLELIAAMKHPLAGIAVAALFTAMVQSSSATTGIIIVLASQGLVTLEAGIALMLGANIGTCVTALLSSIGKPQDALKAAIVHVLFNTIGALLWVGFIPQIALIARLVSPAFDDLSGVAQLAAEVPRQIANSHTFFNLANALLFIGFTPWLARSADWLVKCFSPTPAPETEFQTRFIAPFYLDHPAQALEQARLEIYHMARHVASLVEQGLEAFWRGDHERLAELRRRDDGVDTLHAAIIDFLRGLSQRSTDEATSEAVLRLVTLATYWENTADIIETEFVGLAERLRSGRIQMSVGTADALRPLGGEVARMIRQLAGNADGSEPPASLDPAQMKSEFNRMAESARRHLVRRLAAAEPDRLDHYRLEIDTLENLKRLNTLSRRIAHLGLD